MLLRSDICWWRNGEEETKYACVMLPYDTGLNTIRFEMRKIVWFRGLDILYLFRIYLKTGEIMDLR